MKEPFVSIIIVNYNGAHHLHECLTSIQEIDYPDHEVVLVDNASIDDSIRFVRENFPSVRIIPLSRNYGFAEGSNIGAKNAKGEYIVFLNNDTKVDKKWLSELVKEIIQDDYIATCGSKMLFYDGIRINHAGASITLLGNAYDIGFGQEDNGEFDQKGFVGSTCGGSMILRKKVFDLLGGFDSEYFACSEDVDLCLKAWIYGLKNMYVPSSIVYHKYGETLGKRQSAFRIYFCQKNRLVNILKYFETINIIKGLIISIPYDCVRIMIFLSFMEIKTALSLIKANIDVLIKINPIMQKRKIIQKNRRISDRNIMKMGIITSLTDGIKEFTRLNRLRDN